MNEFDLNLFCSQTWLSDNLSSNKLILKFGFLYNHYKPYTLAPKLKHCLKEFEIRVEFEPLFSWIHDK